MESEIDSKILKAWREGVREWNRGRPWHAHEAWERGWTRLPGPHRLRIQGLIQAAAARVLLEKGRDDAARRISRSALAKLESAPSRLHPRVSIPGLLSWLKHLANSDSEQAQKRFDRLEARLILAKQVPARRGK